MSIQVIKSPTPVNLDIQTMDPAHEIVIFTTGSIEKGTDVDWQTRLEEELKESTKQVTLLNSKRESLDSSSQSTEHINWELENLEKSHFALMYFCPGTNPSISLLELGLFANKFVVYCPEDFEEKENVNIVCQRYNIPVYDNEVHYFNFLKGLCNK